jgi:hypothetical protein
MIDWDYEQSRCAFPSQKEPSMSTQTPGTDGETLEARVAQCLSYQMVSGGTVQLVRDLWARVAALERKNETLRNAWQTSEADRLATVTRVAELEREVEGYLERLAGEQEKNV